jgi:hypothetical protein
MATTASPPFTSASLAHVDTWGGAGQVALRVRIRSWVSFAATLPVRDMAWKSTEIGRYPPLVL